MGYRSEVGMALTQSGVEFLKARLNDKATDAKVRKAVEELLSDADNHHVDEESGAEVWYWDWIKWYEDEDDVAFIMETLNALEDDGDYLFLRLGEDDDDFEKKGTFWDNPFKLGITR